MIELPQYEFETRLYPLTPPEYRWIFNKLQVMERCGVEAGPCGVVPPHDGPWCYKPIMNLRGNGQGGWYKKTGHWYRAGHFWMPWYEGRHAWTEYVNDEPVRQMSGNVIDGYLRFEKTYDFPEVPEAMRGISKYSMIESIGGHMIEWCPRNSENNRETLQDLKLVTDSHGDMIWEELWETSRPW